MGMSASQARMLSLTSRLSDLEYQAQSISNSKLRLADRSTDASVKYQDALSKQKLAVATSSSTSVDASAYNLTTYNAVSTTDKQRFLVDSNNSIYVTSKVGNAYDSSKNVGSTSYYIQNQVGRDTNGDGVDDTNGYKKVADFLKDYVGYSSEKEATAAGKTYDSAAINYYTNVYTGKEAFLNSLGYTSDSSGSFKYAQQMFGSSYDTSSFTYDSGASKYYSNVYDQIAEHGCNSPGDSNMTDPDWLYKQLNTGKASLAEWNSTGGTDGTGGWEKVSWSSGDASLQVQTDSSQVAQAEAEYDTVTSQIKSQDNKYDLQLKQVETEHSAIQTEMDSIKKIIDKNIETSFKSFSA